MQGVLLVDKPADWTSFDVVNYVRRIVANAEGKKPKHVKVGHTGTLDPFATGLLVLLIGKEYTRRAGEFSKVDKTYEVTMKLGETSSTGDPEGDNRGRIDTSPDLEALQAAVEGLQRPNRAGAASLFGYQGQWPTGLQTGPRRPRSHHRTPHSHHQPPRNHRLHLPRGQTSCRSFIRHLHPHLGRRPRQSPRHRRLHHPLRRTKVDKFSIESAVMVQGLNAEKLAEHILA